MSTNADKDELQAAGTEIVVPLKLPYAKLPKPADDAALLCNFEIRFPRQCAWCGSSSVTAMRWVQLYAENQGYVPSGQRLAKKAAAIGLGAVTGIYTSELIKSYKDIEKIRGFAFNLAVPHCADHADTPPTGVLEWVSLAPDLSLFRFRVRDAEYARAIEQTNKLPALVVICECENCGQTFSYEKAFALSINEQQKENVLNTFREGKDIVRKCPHCGYMQSWMIKAAKSDKQTTVAVLSFIGAVIAYIIFAFAVTNRSGIPGSECVLWLGGCIVVPVVITVGIHLLIGRLPFTPNKKFGDITRINKPTIFWKQDAVASSGEPKSSKAG
jgi:hypothetical protein